jgi:hypothetical protein
MPAKKNIEEATMSDEGKRADELTFSLSLAGKVSARVAGGVVFIDLFTSDGKGRPYVPIGSHGVSIPTFEGNERQAVAWINRAQDIFGEWLVDTIRESLALLLSDASSAALIEVGLSQWGKQGALQMHLEVLERLLRARLKIGDGRQPRWTAAELWQAIVTAMESLPESRRTYPGVAKKLQEMHPDRAPKSGESLRKTVEALELNWKKAKRLAQVHGSQNGNGVNR